MLRGVLTAILLSAALLPRSAAANDILCDPSFEDCRTPLLNLIRNEQVGIDVAFWFMEDARYTAELKRAHDRGVPVRVLVDTRANTSTPLNADRLAELQNAGIPMRRRVASGILHWKMMLFAGQNTVQFSAANYSPWALAPVTPYENYTDEVIYFTSEHSVTNSFRTKYDDLWTDTTNYTNYANITGDLARRYDSFPKDPELNFPPLENYRSRAVKQYDLETAAIDVIMYRITDRAHSDAMIRAVQRGIPVRLLTEPKQYRDPSRYWHSWNVDRMYMAGVQIRHRAHAGLLHQKSVLLRSQGMTIFGSSNWTSPSAASQEEHNYFTRKTNFFQWFSDQFERKWNNGAGFAESQPFVPLPPDKPFNVSPADGTADVPTDSVTLTFNGGLWAHKYDIYLGTSSTPPLFSADQPLGPSASPSQHRSITVTGLLPGTTYYWRVVGKTMADRTAAGPVYSFRTAGDAAPPPAPSGSDIVLYAKQASVLAGAWGVVADSTAAGGARIENTDRGLAKLTTAAASPSDYFEMTFSATAGTPYHLWIRGKAKDNSYANDSVHVQFSGSVSATGAPVWRIGTTDSTVFVLQDGSGGAVSGWGWEDNGWDSLGPQVYFASSGTQTIRIQRREDGISIDQIVLSPGTYLTTRPGATKNDSTILPESGGSGSTAAEPPPSGSTLDEIVLYASDATIVGGSWRVTSDPVAAGGRAVENIDRGLSKVTTADAAPSEYIELSFSAEAGKPYRLWLRMRAGGNYWGNDSVHVQFSDSVDSSGGASWRIGTTSSAEVNLEDCGGCGLSGWGWQDNGWGAGVMGPLIRFATSGTHRIRIQRREDGAVLDQIVLSAGTYREVAPGALKNDTVILSKTQ